MALEHATALTGLDDALKESYLAKLLDVSSGDELDLGEIQTAVVSVVTYVYTTRSVLKRGIDGRA